MKHDGSPLEMIENREINTMRNRSNLKDVFLKFMVIPELC